MCTIQVKQFMINKSFPEAGNDLYNFIIKKINIEEKIVLNLEGVDVLPSMFLNVSIGKIVKIYGFNTLRDKISFSHITSSQAERLKIYLMNIRKTRVL